MLFKHVVVGVTLVSCAQAVPNVRRLTGPAPIEVGAWIDAANGHKPGVADAHAVEAGTWSDDRMRKAVLPRLRQLADDTWDNDLAKRGAMLHTDVALFGLAASDLRGAGRIARNRDSRSEGLGRTNAHLDVARELLQWVQPKPALDADVELWYRTLAAWFFATDQLGDLTYHLESGRTLFRQKAWLQFTDGCLSETMASPRVEALIGSSRHASYLSAAERGFRRALDTEPALHEARVRLGHVLGVQGRYDAAVEELQAALSAVDQVELRYLALLFLGRAGESSGRVDLARQSFASAAGLLPAARAPLVALSRLAAETGDRHQAATLADRVLDLPGGGDVASDPWWTYDRCTGAESRRLLAELRRRIASLRP